MPPRSGLASLPVAWIVCLCTGCVDTTETQPVDPPVPIAEPKTNHSPSAEPATIQGAQRTQPIAGLTFLLPDNWSEIELSPEQRGFVDARFEIATASEPLTLTVTSVGGGIEANIERWLGQMQLESGDSPVIEEFEVGGIPATWVDLRGTFQAGLTGGLGDSQENWRMIGIAFAHRPRDVYLKIVGPRPAISEIEDQIRAFANSATAE